MIIIVVILSQVKVARALCQDYPVRYIVARASYLKDSLTGEGEEDLPGANDCFPNEEEEEEEKQRGEDR